MISSATPRVRSGGLRDFGLSAAISLGRSIAMQRYTVDPVEDQQWSQRIHEKSWQTGVA